MGRRGFTLVEVMVTVAIIGILASLAVPRMSRFQLRARMGEAMVNLSAIKRAQSAYFSEGGTYIAAPAVPAALPGNTATAWPTGTAFDVLGWRPEGNVYFQYAVNADNGGTPGGPLIRYTAEASADIDADGTPTFFANVRPLPGAAVGLPGALPGTTCVGTGIYRAITNAQDLLDTPGPCSAGDGRSNF